MPPRYTHSLRNVTWMQNFSDINSCTSRALPKRRTRRVSPIAWISVLHMSVLRLPMGCFMKYNYHLLYGCTYKVRRRSWSYHSMHLFGGFRWWEKSIFFETRFLFDFLFFVSWEPFATTMRLKVSECKIIQLRW